VQPINITAARTTTKKIHVNRVLPYDDSINAEDQRQLLAHQGRWGPISQVLQRKLMNGTYMYLVLWLWSGHTTWVHESDIRDKAVLDAYKRAHAGRVHTPVVSSSTQHNVDLMPVFLRNAHTNHENATTPHVHPNLQASFTHDNTGTLSTPQTSNTQHDSQMACTQYPSNAYQVLGIPKPAPHCAAATT
jgi:hypothetical protein